jgi:hypothetical protein
MNIPIAKTAMHGRQMRAIIRTCLLILARAIILFSVAGMRDRSCNSTPTRALSLQILMILSRLPASFLGILGPESGSFAMSDSTASRRLHPSRSLALQIVVFLAIVATLGVSFKLVVRGGSGRTKTAHANTAPFFEGATPFLCPGILRPHTYRADTAPLGDGDEVIGVMAGGKARAYLVAAFAGQERHVVNDLVAGRPVTVTHCDLSNCTRVFTNSNQGQVLDIACGGRYRGSLLLATPAGICLQDDAAGNPGMPAVPYEQLPFTLTTWGEWKHLHADTDAYVGGDSE